MLVEIGVLVSVVSNSFHLTCRTSAVLEQNSCLIAIPSHNFALACALAFALGFDDLEIAADFENARHNFLEKVESTAVVVVGKSLNFALGWCFGRFVTGRIFVTFVAVGLNYLHVHVRVYSVRF